MTQSEKEPEPTRKEELKAQLVSSVTVKRLRAPEVPRVASVVEDMLTGIKNMIPVSPGQEEGLQLILENGMRDHLLQVEHYRKVAGKCRVELELLRRETPAPIRKKQK